MPALCSSWPSSRPEGPAPMIATCVLCVVIRRFPLATGAARCFSRHRRATRTALRHPLVQQLDPVPHRRPRPALQMREAADVGGRDDVRPPASSAASLFSFSCPESTGCRIEYVPAEPQHRCASATGVSAWPMREQDLLDRAADAACRAAACTASGTRRAAPALVHRAIIGAILFHSGMTISIGSRASSDDLRRLARRTPASWREQMAVVLDHHAAAARGDHDRLGAGCDVRPPRVDVAPDDARASSSAVEVMRQRAAAARLRRRASARCRCGRARARSPRRCRGASDGCTQPSSTASVARGAARGHVRPRVSRRDAIGERRAAASRLHACARSPARCRTASRESSALRSSAALRALGGRAADLLLDDARGRCRPAARIARPRGTSSRSCGR